MILVTGFGPFLEVRDNPSGALARAIDGRIAGPHEVVGREIPVSYTRGPDITVALAQQLGVAAVIGLGVARSTDTVRVERTAVSRCSDVPDVDGHAPDALGEAPVVHATLDVYALARALGAPVSDDAGAYVCNGWLYRVASALDVPVGFIHIPPAGLSENALLSALAGIPGPDAGLPR